jgi:hypothetical protein
LETLLDDLSFLSDDADERNWMDREFEESEMLEVVRNYISEVDKLQIQY